MMKIPKQEYTAEFKGLAVKRIKEGMTPGAAAKVVTPEQMELSRLRTENVRLKRENEILKKATAYFARDTL
jgi:transposase